MTWLGARSAHHGGVHLELAGHALLFSVKHTAGDHELDKVDALRAGGDGNPLTRKTPSLGEGAADARRQIAQNCSHASLRHPAERSTT